MLPEAFPDQQLSQESVFHYTLEFMRILGPYVQHLGPAGLMKLQGYLRDHINNRAQSIIKAIFAALKRSVAPPPPPAQAHLKELREKAIAKLRGATSLLENTAYSATGIMAFASSMCLTVLTSFEVPRYVADKILALSIAPPADFSQQDAGAMIWLAQHLRLAGACTDPGDSTLTATFLLQELYPILARLAVVEDATHKWLDSYRARMHEVHRYAAMATAVPHRTATTSHSTPASRSLQPVAAAVTAPAQYAHPVAPTATVAPKPTHLRQQAFFFCGKVCR